MTVFATVLAGLKKGRVRAELSRELEAPSDLMDLMIHEAQGQAVPRAQRVQILSMSAPDLQPACPPVGCKGCFFATACPSGPNPT